MLYNKERHEKLTDNKWNKEKAVEVIDEIFNKTINDLTEEKLWERITESGESKYLTTQYVGASGTLIGLRRIAKFKNINLPVDEQQLIDRILKEYYDSHTSEDRAPSLFLGESVILYLKYLITQDTEILNRLYEVIDNNTNNPVNEALWGSPGTMLLALEVYKSTGEEKWKELFLKSSDYLNSEWHIHEELGYPIWTQDLYGEITHYVGAAHGFFGNVYPLLAGLDCMSPESKRSILDKTTETTIKSCVREGELANWPALFDREVPKKLVQWCHGAPGVITSLTPYPVDHNTEVESLLKAAGELIWEAGPLTKKVGICHGTDGNGFAFLKLFERTQENKWLDRAKAFAMHAMGQRRNDYSLWCGDIGFACYLASCCDLDSKIPGLEVF